jgi:hypothetical protein
MVERNARSIKAWYGIIYFGCYAPSNLNLASLGLMTSVLILCASVGALRLHDAEL